MQGLVEYLDTCLFSFFEENPCGTYVSEPLSSFSRLILHSIAHYYELNSLSEYIVSETVTHQFFGYIIIFLFSGYNAKPRGDRFTKVTNSLDYFNPPSLSLSQYLEKLHSNFCKSVLNFTSVGFGFEEKLSVNLICYR